MLPEQPGRHAAPPLSGDPATDWALWRLFLLVAEVATTQQRREQ